MLRVVLTWSKTRMHLSRLPGTGISRAHISGTSVQPSPRAATAGNSASRSSVRLKIALAISSVCKSLWRIINCRSSVVAERISSRLLCSTVVAPRMPRQYIKCFTPLEELIPLYSTRDAKVLAIIVRDARHYAQYSGYFLQRGVCLGLSNTLSEKEMGVLG